MSIKEKMQDLQFYVNRIFVTHNLSSNSGVIATVLDEAQEQVRGWGRGVCCWARTDVLNTSPRQQVMLGREQEQEAGCGGCEKMLCAHVLD